MSTEPGASAETVYRMGRWFLVVNGVYVAMEDNPCQDVAFDGLYWTAETLEQAAALINERRWASAADRFERGPE